MARSRFDHVLIVVVLGVLCAGVEGIGSHDENLNINCSEKERNALLRFRQGFKDRLGLLSSWVVEEDCCKWRGVGCSNISGHVISVDLHSPTDIMQGTMSSSLDDLQYLSYLDLSHNDFCQTQVPEFIGSLYHLEYLNLSNANFKGTIPGQLGNLSRLQFLDLSGNMFSLRASNLEWIHGLSFLKVLDLGGVDLSSTHDWLVSINMLPSLVKLNLSGCQLKKLPPYLPFVNFTLLEFLDLSFNDFNSPLPHWLSNISQSLVHLNLGRSRLQGSIPIDFANMTALSFLDLSKNNLKGGFPTISSLKELYLSSNRLEGSFGQILPRLSHLVVLDIAYNSFDGVVSESHLSNFTELRVLDFSSNSFLFNVSSSWIPAFQLETIGLKSCKLGPRFPKWLRTQTDFLSIDISDAGISDIVPNWFWNFSADVNIVNLSSNALRGEIPDLSSKTRLSVIDLSDNVFHGPLPHFTPNIKFLILSQNKFSGPLSLLCEMMVVNNSLGFLDLSHNFLLGPVPDCWAYGQNLMDLNLAVNNLSGILPNSLGNLVHLKTLRLDINHFSGELPLALKNCTGLLVMDLTGNELSGNIPAWIGESFVNLMILRLGSNAFHGNIPSQICKLKYLIYLSLASNRLSGKIPKCIDGFLTMALVEAVRSYLYDPYTAYKKDLLMIKMESLRPPMDSLGIPILFFKALDLSSNVLSGEIPEELSSLIGLIVLNLSRNSFTGIIPRDIGAIGTLEALDLSENRLSCSIPPGMLNL